MTLSTDEIAAQIGAWLQAALRQARHDDGSSLRVLIAEDLDPYDNTDMFRVEPLGRWLHVSIHQPNLSVFADVRVVDA